jgi:hypothetical protein
MLIITDLFTIKVLDKIFTYFPPISVKVQKGAYYSGLKIYNHLPKKLKQLSSD